MTTGFASDVLRQPAGDAVALETRHAAYDRHALAQAVSAARAWLEEQGVRPGDRVLFAMANSFELVVLLIAAMDIGAIETTLSPHETAYVARPIARALEPRLIIASVGSDAVLPEYDWREHVLPGGEGGFRAASGHAEVDRDHAEQLSAMTAAGVISIQFTSGSTGAPKGIAHTLEGMRATVFAAPHLADHRDQRLYLSLPICNSYGKTQLFELLYGGGTVILGRASSLPNELATGLIENRATAFEAPPAVYELLIRSSAARTGGLSGLRRLGMAGGKVRPELLRSLRSAAPGAQITNRFGVTEVSGGLTRAVLDDDDLAADVIHCGQPFPFVELRVVDDDGRDAGRGGLGAVVVRSPGQMWGRFPRPGDAPATDAADVPFATGDLGYLDDCGRLVLVDRTVDVIKRAGVRICPAELEECLRQATGVGECVVLGVEHGAALGERVVAWVTRASTDARGDTSALLAHARAHLPANRRPDDVVWVERIPVGRTGKVDRQALLDRYHATRASAQNSHRA